MAGGQATSETKKGLNILLIDLCCLNVLYWIIDNITVIVYIAAFCTNQQEQVIAQSMMQFSTLIWSLCKQNKLESRLT